MSDRWQEIYKKNLYLDEIFNEKYKDDPELFNKNCIEFLVELGEFINETKVFKYWSIKKPNKEAILEEFADAITMTLYFYGVLNIKEVRIEETFQNKSDNILTLLNTIYLDGTKLMYNLDENLINRIFTNLIGISKMLDLEENKEKPKIEIDEDKNITIYYKFKSLENGY